LDREQFPLVHADNLFYLHTDPAFNGGHNLLGVLFPANGAGIFAVVCDAYSAGVVVCV